MSFEFPEEPARKFKIEHDEIWHRGYVARDAGILANKNPFSRENCKEQGIKYDEKKDQSWMMGWCDGDRQSEMEIDGEKL